MKCAGVSPGPFSALNLDKIPRAINTPPTTEDLLKLSDGFAKEEEKP
jgi:hypothetical protein